MATFSSLPTELHFSILSNVLQTSQWYDHSRRNLSLVCRLWNSILNHPLLSPPTLVEEKFPFTEYEPIGEAAIGSGPVHGGVQYIVHLSGLHYGYVTLRIWHGMNREELGEKRMWIHKFLKEIGHNVSFPLPKTVAISKKKAEGVALEEENILGELSFYRKGNIYQLPGIKRTPGSYASSYPRLRGIEHVDMEKLPRGVSYENYKDEPLCIWWPEGKPSVGELFVEVDFHNFRWNGFENQDLAGARGWPPHRYVPMNRLPAYSRKTDYITVGEIMEYMNRKVQKGEISRLLRCRNTVIKWLREERKAATKVNGGNGGI